MGKKWDLIKQALFALIGGLIGAIFGTVSQDKFPLNLAFYLSIIYLAPFILVIYWIEVFIDKREKIESR